MFILKKIYCRTFQKAFRFALPILPYRNPTIIHDKKELPAILRQEKITCTLIVTDKGIVETGLVKLIEELLNQANLSYVIFSDTHVNPTVDDVENALTVYHKRHCNGIIAIGGGSSMDLAKAVGARVVYKHKTVNQLGGLLKVLKKLPTLIAVATTAGTGSEVTLASVITDTQNHHKYALMSFPLIPKYALLDPLFTYSLPPHLTSTTGMDALTHAVEAYIGKSTTKETRRLSIEAVKLVFENIEEAYQNGENYKARKNMLLAAYKAGIAFSKSYVGYIHAIAHSLGGQYGTPHGKANAIIMPYMLKAYGKSVYKSLYALALETKLCTSEDSLEVGAKRFIEKIETLNRNMNIETHLSINVQDIPKMAYYAQKEANPLYPVPKLMTQKELEVIYKQISK